MQVFLSMKFINPLLVYRQREKQPFFHIFALTKREINLSSVTAPEHFDWL